MKHTWNASWLVAATATAVAVAIGGGCSTADDTVDGFSQAELDKLHSMSPLPATPPKDTTNAHADDPKAAALGQRLFFDHAFSGPIITADDASGGLGQVGERGKVACVSCHDPQHYFIDTRSKPGNVALGADWNYRNASSILNSSYYGWLENDGLRDSQWSDGLTDPEFPPSMNGSRLLVAHVLYQKYRDDYNAIFSPPLDPDLDPASPNAGRFPPEGLPDGVNNTPPGPWEQMAPADQAIVNTIFANFGKSVQAYVRKMVSRNSPFDRYVAGDLGAISPAAKRGLKLFIGKAGCDGCHNGPLLSDDKFHNTGLKAEGPHVIVTENGRFDALANDLTCGFDSDSEFSDDTHTGRITGLMPVDSDKGKWRTKGIRTIAETAPYMHTGQFATLKDVVDFYNKGGSPDGFVGTKDDLAKPLNLSDAEVSDLVEFLGTLTGDLPPAELMTDTSAK